MKRFDATIVGDGVGRPVRIRATMLLLVLSASCAESGDRDQARWDGRVERVGSIDVVRNPDRPLLGASAIIVDPIWDLPTDPAAVDDGWQNPVRVVLADSSIYVLDDMARRVYRVSLDGVLTQRLGREGAGPGEFRRPFGVAVVDGMLVVGDGGKGSLEVLRQDGTHTRSIPLRGVGFSVWTLKPGRLLVNAMTGGGGSWRTFELDGPPLAWGLPEVPRANAADGVPCTQVATAGEHVLQMNCTVPAFQVISNTGRVTREIRIEQEQQQADPEALGRFEAKVSEQMAGVGYPPDQTKRMVEQTTEKFRIKRSMRRVQFDDTAGLFAIWRQDPEELGGGNATLHLLSEGGVFLASVDFPTPWVDFVIRDSRVYALTQEPATGIVRLSAYQLRIPAGAKEAARKALRQADRTPRTGPGTGHTPAPPTLQENTR